MKENYYLDVVIFNRTIKTKKVNIGAYGELIMKLWYRYQGKMLSFLLCTEQTDYTLLGFGFDL